MAHHGLELRSRCHGRPRNADLLPEHVSDLHGPARAGRRTIGHQPAQAGQAAQALSPGRLAHAIENQVHSPARRMFLHALCEVRLEAVEDDIGAELPHATDVLGPTRHRQHARPEQTGDLNGRGGDPTRCSRNEQRLAILEPTPGLQRPPGRLVRQGCGSRDSKFQVIRDPVEIPRRDPNPFRGPAGHVLPEDLEVQA